MSEAPPLILGHRGSPLEAPENTLASLRRALDLGLDGVEYDVHSCASGEAILIHDETLDRTTDAHGYVRDKTLPELFGVDAGGWFHRHFAGEPLPLLEEALDLSVPGRGPSERPLHMIELKEPGLVGEVARAVAERGAGLPVRLASFHRGVCLEARDLGLPAMLLADEANEDDRRFMRDERVDAYGVGPGGWRTAAGAGDWRCERWSWSVDEPRDLLEACRTPLFGINTNEPRRALATRSLVRLAPEWSGDYPIGVGELDVAPGAHGAEGEWFGAWKLDVRLANPFPFRVEVELELAVRRGAFEVEGLPATRALPPLGAATVPCGLKGGSWSPGGDPLVAGRFRWDAGPGRAAGELALDTPLHRRRTLLAAPEARRVRMLNETPGQREATMAIRRDGPSLLASVENAGGLTELRALVLVGHDLRRGGRGLRARLPLDFDQRADGIPFACGFEGRDPTGAHVLRRWCGGLPPGVHSGAPGRLMPLR